jgi:hypothetical protein
MIDATIIDGGKGKPLPHPDECEQIELLEKMKVLEHRIAVLESEAAVRMKFPDTRKAGSIAPHPYDGWKIT